MGLTWVSKLFHPESSCLCPRMPVAKFQSPSINNSQLSTGVIKGSKGEREGVNEGTKMLSSKLFLGPKAELKEVDTCSNKWGTFTI